MTLYFIILKWSIKLRSLFRLVQTQKYRNQCWFELRTLRLGDTESNIKMKFYMKKYLRIVPDFCLTSKVSATNFSKLNDTLDKLGCLFRFVLTLSIIS